MSRYLSPRNDVTFKHVFAKNKRLCIALLNAFLPVEEPGMGKVEQVESIERLPSELIPDLDGIPYSVIDVRCTDSNGRQFIVEMQLRWESSFDQRILRNVALSYGEQKLEKRKFHQLRPVYALNFLFDSLDADAARSPERAQEFASIFGEHPDKIYYRYLFTEVECHELHIRGLEMIFVDMKKFVRAADRATLRGLTELRSLWLDLLTGVDEDTWDPPLALTQNPDTAEALKCLEVGAYDKMERLLYRKIEDAKCIAATAFDDSHREGVAEGRAEGVAEERARAAVEIEAERAKAADADARAAEATARAAAAAAEAAAILANAKQEKLETARNLKALHLDASTIAQATGLSVEEIVKL